MSRASEGHGPPAADGAGHGLSAPTPAAAEGHAPSAGPEKGAPRARRRVATLCAHCGMPAPQDADACPRCGGQGRCWVAEGGRGTIYSYVVRHRPPGTQGPPQVLAVVELEEGPQVLAPLLVEEGELPSLAVGRAVALTLGPAPPEAAGIAFRLVEQTAGPAHGQEAG